MLDNTPQPLLYQQPHLACAIFIILYTQMLANTILNTHIYFYFYILGILIFLYPLYQLLLKWIPSQEPISLDIELKKIRKIDAPFKIIKSYYLFWQSFFSKKVWSPVTYDNSTWPWKRDRRDSISFMASFIAIIVTISLTWLSKPYAKYVGLSDYGLFLFYFLSGNIFLITLIFLLYRILRVWFY